MASIGFREAMVRYSSKFTMGRCHTSVLSSHGPPLVGTKEVSPGLPRMELPCPHLADLPDDSPGERPDRRKIGDTLNEVWHCLPQLIILKHLVKIEMLTEVRFHKQRNGLSKKVNSKKARRPNQGRSASLRSGGRENLELARSAASSRCAFRHRYCATPVFPRRKPNDCLGCSETLP